MSLATAIDFAKRGFAVLPVGPNKRPWTLHGVNSASADPSVFCRFDWNGAACAIATGENVEVLDVDLRGSVHTRSRTYEGQENSSPACVVSEGVDGFATLASLGIASPLTVTLCARTPSGGLHAWFKPVCGKSRTIGPGVEWFSKGKYVVAPPAPGRAWLNDLPIAEAPEELKRIVLAAHSHTHHGAGRNSFGPLMAAEGSSGQVPKPIYSLILRLMPKASRREQRRAIGLFNVVSRKRSGRNNALNYTAYAFRELVPNAIEASGVCTLLVEACRINGYLEKDGEEAVLQTIMSGLGLREAS